MIRTWMMPMKYLQNFKPVSKPPFFLPNMRTIFVKKPERKWTLEDGLRPPDDPEKQGEQLEAQSCSRERWIKEIAKKSGLPSGYYKEWSFSHQTRGDSLSPITVVTVTQPWQRNKLFDYTKKHANTGKLQEKFFINDKEETDWNRITQEFGKYQEQAVKPKELKVQPQISLWDRVTGLPLKIGMSIAEEAKIPFKHSWKDLTLTHKDSGEYILWSHYGPSPPTKAS